MIAIAAPPDRAKTDAELQHWSAELARLRRWWQGAEADWWGLPAPSERDRRLVSSDAVVNAVHTALALRPGYVHQLGLSRTAFCGLRVLEVGCGPLGQLLQFVDRARHGLDPLVDEYVAAGWPLDAYAVARACARGEDTPTPTNSSTRSWR